MESRNPISGIILSGGKSTRMGKNKAFIEVDGIPIIKRIHALFQKLLQEIIIVTNQGELFMNLDARIYSDLVPGQGVLGGLYTGLFFSSFPYSFCVACDMPFLKESLIEYFIREIHDDYDVIVPRTKDGLQPLHAIYSRNCLGPIKKILEEKKYKIVDFYPMIRIRIIGEDEFLSFDPNKESFINVNTPEDLSSMRTGKHTL